VFNWLRTQSIWCKAYKGEKRVRAFPNKFLSDLSEGVAKDKNDKDLLACEKAISFFFTNLYSDVKSVQYIFTPYNNRYKYELYFEKLVDGEVLHIPASLESTGTQKLMDILPVLLMAVWGSTVFVDEIDSGIHDLLMKNIIEMVCETMAGQLIVTTHNTLLLENIKPENAYIINIDADGNKEVNCIEDYEERTQKNHNIQKKYLRGDYAGVPFPASFDFSEMSEDLFHEFIKKGNSTKEDILLNKQPGDESSDNK